MDYTICQKVVERSVADPRCYFEVLAIFANSQNGNRVCQNNKILQDYEEIAQKSNGLIRTWIDAMTNSCKWKAVRCEQDNIYIETCKLTTDKHLIVSEKEDYDTGCYNGLNVFDAAEARAHLCQAIAITVVQNGNQNQAAVGDNSPNIRKG